MNNKMKSICFTSLWIIAIIFLFDISTVSCTVSSDPTITGPDTVKENDNATLLCKATCTNGTCIYKWTFSNSEKHGDAYHIISIKRSDTGPYTCTVHDLDGTTKQISHSITVNYGPDKNAVTINYSNTTSIYEGSSYEIVCTCGECRPSCSAAWKYEEKFVGLKGSLKFDNISRSQAGKYIYLCFNNATNKRVEKEFMLNVQYPPDVTVSWNAAKKELTCRAVGNPDKYNFTSWTHEVDQTVVRKVPGDHTAGTDTSTISLTGQKPYMDTGIYTCGVSNGIAGRTNSLLQTKNETVEMPDKPVLVEIKSQYNVSKGSDVVISSKIYALPSVSENDIFLTHSNSNISIEGVDATTNNKPMAVMFYKKNVTVNCIDIGIHISEVKEDYFGELNVKLKNYVGYITETVILIPQGAPDPPTNITCTVDVYSVLISLKPGFYNGANQTFYVEYSTDRNASYWNNNTFVEAGFRKAADYFKNVTVKGLQPETTYYFRLRGANIYGKSDYTEIIEVKTLKEPLNIAAIAGGVAAGVVVIILIVIVVVVIRRRTGTKDRKSKELIPMPNITDNSCSDQAPIIARSPYTNVDAPGNTNSVVYENTLKLNIDHKDATDSTSKEKKEPIYTNTQLNKIEEKPPEESHYQNYDPKKLKKDGSLENLQSDYYNQEIKQAASKEPESPKSPTEQPYLDMELCYEVKEDYINTEAFKKPKLEKIAPKKPASKETYESMTVTNRRESVPDYVAPSPPAKDEEDLQDYMNLHMGRKS